MRTVIDKQGCNTTQGPVGLTVHEGDLVVNGTDIGAAIRELRAAHTHAATKAPAEDTTKVQVEQLVSSLTEQVEGAKSELSEMVDSLKKDLVSLQKDLKDSKKENEKLAERVKSLEADLKKAIKSSGKSAEA